MLKFQFKSRLFACMLMAASHVPMALAQETSAPNTGTQLPLDLLYDFDDHGIVVERNDYDIDFVRELSGFDGKLPLYDLLLDTASIYYSYQDIPATVAPFDYKFKCWSYTGKVWKLTQTVYLYNADGECSSQPTFKLVDNYGGQTTRASVYVYDDATNTLLDQIESETNSATLNLDDSVYGIRLIRLEIVFFGQFPNDSKYDGMTGLYNGLGDFILKPIFYNIPNCYKMAVNILPESCPELVGSKECLGSAKTVTTASVKDGSYNWYVYEQDSWKALVIDGEEQLLVNKQTQSIPVDKFGINYYKVTVNDGYQSRNQYFYIEGDDCELQGIENAKPDVQTVNVYDSFGRMLRSNVEKTTCLSGLPNGVYIVNGEKVVVNN